MLYQQEMMGINYIRPVTWRTFFRFHTKYFLAAADNPP